jgi:hypothetical protein
MRHFMVKIKTARIFNRIFETRKSGKKEENFAKNSVLETRRSGIYYTCINYDGGLNETSDLLTPQAPAAEINSSVWWWHPMSCLGRFRKCWFFRDQVQAKAANGSKCGLLRKDENYPALDPIPAFATERLITPANRSDLVMGSGLTILNPRCTF